MTHLHNRLRDLQWFLKDTKNNIRRFKERLAIWFGLFKVTKGIYVFEGETMLQYEYYHLKKTLAYMESNPIVMSAPWQVARMKTALKLLGIIFEDDAVDMIEDENGVECLIEPGYKYIWKCKYKVNTKNSKRFLECTTTEPEIFKGELYLAKAWHLYNLIHERDLRSFGD